MEGGEGEITFNTSIQKQKLYELKVFNRTKRILN